MEHIGHLVILAAFVAICATMFGRRENWSPFGLVVFALAVLAIYVSLTVWGEVIGYDELTP